MTISSVRLAAIRLSFACVFAALAMNPAAAGTPAYIPLHRFTRLQGYDPCCGVVRDSARNLYGTTPYGGASASDPLSYGAGVVYKLDDKGHYTILHNFTGGADGGQPMARPVLDPQGNLYGTTLGGGSSGKGVVFKIDPAGQETVLYNFTGSSDGGSPVSPLIRDPSGSLYGTTNGDGSNAGVIYKLDPAGQFTTLYSFTKADAAYSCTTLILDEAGNLHGICGAAGNEGLVYKLDAAGRRTILYRFGCNNTDGCYPVNLVRDKAGNLFGATAWGGPGNNGIIFKVDPAGKETILATLGGGGGPTADMALDRSGTLYGTTTDTIYKLDTAGQLTVLYNFTVFSGHYGNGGSGVILDRNGDLYGTVGTNRHGVLFKFKQ